MTDAGSQLCDRIRVVVSSRLRKLREREGISQAELARRTHIHRPIIGRIERGTHVPNLDTCAVVAHALGASLNDVLWELDRQLGLRRAARKRVYARARNA